VEDLVHGDADTLTRNVQIKRLCALNATDIRVTSSALHHVDVVAMLPGIGLDKLKTWHLLLNHVKRGAHNLTAPLVKFGLECIGHHILASSRFDVFVP